MNKKFNELETGDKVWIIDNEANLCEHTVKSLKSWGLRTKIEFKEGDYVAGLNLNCSTMMTNLIYKKDFIFVYIGTDKNELIENYVDKMKVMINNTRKTVDEGLTSIERMQDKLAKIRLKHD